MIDSDLDLARDLVGEEFSNNAASSSNAAGQRVREITKIVELDKFKEMQVCRLFILTCKASFFSLRQPILSRSLLRRYQRS